MSIYKGKEYIWICECCQKIFNTRMLLNLHYKEFPNHKIRKNGQNKIGEFKCKYCGKIHKYISACHNHEKYCNLNPNKIYSKSKGKKMSDDFKKKRSEEMKNRFKNGTGFSYAFLRSKEKPSYPEQWIMKVIENEVNNKNYIREYRFHTFSLDFVWLNEKKVIEIDGRFHKISEYQKDCDRRKDKLLKEEGWQELRIDWEYCFNNTQEIINKIKNFIDN